MRTPADVVALAVELTNAWHDQASGTPGGEQSQPWPEGG